MNAPEEIDVYKLYCVYLFLKTIEGIVINVNTQGGRFDPLISSLIYPQRIAIFI